MVDNYKFSKKIDDTEVAVDSDKTQISDEIKFKLQSGHEMVRVDLSGKDFRAFNFERPLVFTECNFSGSDFTSANFQEKTVFVRCNFSNAILSDAKLSYANLCFANLSGISLVGTDLSEANLFGADLENADLKGANLHNVTLRGAKLKGADLYGTFLVGAIAEQAELTREDLKRAIEGFNNIYRDHPDHEDLDPSVDYASHAFADANIVDED